MQPMSRHKKQRFAQSKKSRGRGEGEPARKQRPLGAGRPTHRKTWPGLYREKVLRVMADAGTSLSASQLVGLLNLPGEAGREAAIMLRELGGTGQVIETRPGRFAVAGADGEHQVTVGLDPADKPQVTFTDGTTAPLHPRHRLGTQPGDVAIGMRDDAGQVLLVRVLRRGGQLLLGTLRFARGNAMLVPDNRREDALPVIAGDTQLLARYNAGDRMIGRVLQDTYGQPGVELLRALGDDAPEQTDFDQICLQHGLPGALSPPVLEEVAALQPDWALGQRRDCRDDLVFTIDPETAKDFDDAISVQHRPGGGWRLAVHIADVSHFVRYQSAIDEEAVLRGTSVYLINRVIPMLPEQLSNGWCSLVPHEPRYALSVFIELTESLDIQSVTPAETLIQSRCRLTYEQAQAVIDEQEPDAVPPEVCEGVRAAHRLSQGLRHQRIRRGALNLFSVEQRFALDVEGQPVEVSAEGHDQSHQLIEELMLLANRCVAAWLDDHRSPCVYRVHGEPSEDRLVQFVAMCRAYGLECPDDLRDRFVLQQVLDRIGEEPHASRLVLNYLCLRCFQKAVYQVTNIGHYALAFRHYAHFTSPIRRYPDLLVHRLVKRVLGLPAYQQVDHDPVHLDALARSSSFLEQRAEYAERAIRAIKAARYLSTRIGDVFSAVVTMAGPHGLYVQLLETGLDGFVPVRELGTDFFEYDQQGMALVGRTTGERYGIGRLCDVQVAAVDIPRGQAELHLAKRGPGGI